MSILIGLNGEMLYLTNDLMLLKKKKNNFMVKNEEIKCLKNE